jgi:hypothetical protein
VSDDQNLSKRERQKQRRQQRLEMEAAAARKDRTKRTVATFAVVALVVGALGVWGVGAWQDRAERRQAIEEARANLEALGCTQVEEQPVLPSQHLSGNELASNPPETLYPDRPTTSGRHLGGVATSGAFDKVVDERLLVHNLEHGYVSIYVSQDVPDEEWQQVADFVTGEIDGGTEKIIASRWKAEMPNDASFSFNAWGARQVCEQWDRGVALAFLSEWHYLEGNAPERTIQPHRGGNRGGGQDPDEVEGDLLFPPLGEPPAEEGVEDVMTEPEGNVEEGEDGPRDDDAGATPEPEATE